MDYHLFWNILIFPFAFAFGLVGFLIGAASLVFWVWMLIDVIQRKFKNHNDKIVWLLVIIFTHVVGAAIYYFLVKKTHKN